MLFYSLFTFFPVEIETRKDVNDVTAAVAVKRDATAVGVQGAELLTRRGRIIAAAAVDPTQVGTHTHTTFERFVNLSLAREDTAFSDNAENLDYLPDQSTVVLSVLDYCKGFL